jgi:hypothetical protein
MAKNREQTDGASISTISAIEAEYEEISNDALLLYRKYCFEFSYIEAANTDFH